MSMAEISRRRFIQAFGAVAATSSFALAGCGAQRASEADGSAAAGGTADTITFAQGADPRGLDPRVRGRRRVRKDHVQHLRHAASL